MKQIARSFGLTCSHNGCTADPCEEVTRKVTQSILKVRVEQERLGAINSKCREEIKRKPRAKLLKGELLLLTGIGAFPIEQLLSSNRVISTITPSVIGILCTPERTYRGKGISELSNGVLSFINLEPRKCK